MFTKIRTRECDTDVLRHALEQSLIDFLDGSADADLPEPPALCDQTA